MTFVGVVVTVGRLVGAAEADQIGRQDPMTRRDELRDDVPIQVGPAGLTVQKQHCGTLPRAFIHPGHPQGLPGVGIGDVGVVRLEGPTGQILEAAVGGAQNFYVSLLVRSRVDHARSYSMRSDFGTLGISLVMRWMVPRNRYTSG